MSLHSAKSSSSAYNSSPSAGKSPSGVTESGNVSASHFPPNGLNRSGIACWWSILNLIKDARKEGIPCYMWTLTFAKVYPDSWCGNMHALLVRKLGDDAKAGHLGPHGFAGVRVTEVHPGGHGIHFHWIMRGRLPLHRVRKRAKECGFGHIFIARDERNRFRKVDEGAAGYVAKYLTKGDKLAGVRSWACIGSYDGTKTKDIEFDSQQNRVFRSAYRTAKLAGAPPTLCFQTAVLASRNYAHNADDRDKVGGVGGLEAGGPSSPALEGRETQSGIAGIMGDTASNSVDTPPCKHDQRASDIQRFSEAAMQGVHDAIRKQFFKDIS